MSKSSDDRLLACLIYVSSFFTTFIGPFLIWIIKKDDSALIDHHGKEYFNFLISYFIYGVISGILMFVLIGFVLIFIVEILAFVFTIVAAVKAYNGECYRIPLVIHFFK